MKNNVNFLKKSKKTIKYLLCLFICVIFTGCSEKKNNDIPENIKEEKIQIDINNEIEEKEEAVVPEEDLEEVVDASMLPYSDVIDEEYIKKCIFLGDSRMVGMSQLEYMPHQNTLAQIGLCHTNAMSTRYKTYAGADYSFKSYLQSHQASVIYICYGINGIKSINEENYENAFRKIIESVKELEPESAIVISSIWPVNDEGKYKASVSTELVKKYNEFLHELALEEEIYFIDLCSELALEDGSINPAYDSGDGLHYNQAGYEVVVDYILHHPVPELYEAEGFNSFAKEDFIWVNPVKPKTEETVEEGNAEQPDNPEDDSIQNGDGQDDNYYPDGNVGEQGEGENPDEANPDEAIPVEPVGEDIQPDGDNGDNGGESPVVPGGEGNEDIVL